MIEGRSPLRPLLAVVVLALVVVVSVSSVATGTDRGRGTDSGSGTLAAGSVTLAGDAGVPGSVLASRTFFESSSSVVLISDSASPDDVRRASEYAVAHGVPMFRVRGDNADLVRRELTRLGTRTAVGVGGGVPDDLGVELVGDENAAPGTPSGAASGEPIVFTVADEPDAGATARAAGVRSVELPTGDPRSTGDAVAALKSDPSRPVVAVGSSFGDAATLRQRLDAARTVPELPGGGQIVFPGRRMVALYGSPGTPALGPLGAQDLPSSIRRAKRVAAQYNRISKAPVIPSFEIIATVASADPGFRGMYTNPIDPAVLEPWVDAAGRAGMYVTIDLQPGRMDFLTQAKMYRRLLEKPHVGLALDPEWRLRPDQVHLTQIGAVDPAEINRTAAWLAGIVREKNLPQKAFVLHQFDAAMLGDRSRIDTSNPELQVVVHADGHGTPDVKMGTWRRIVDGLSPDIWMGWKNFYTEDKPMFSPGRTLAVDPEPWFISYQ